MEKCFKADKTDIGKQTWFYNPSCISAYCCKPEVSQFYGRAILADEEATSSDVPMDHILAMKMTNGTD